MARSITVDGLELSQVVLLKDAVSGKITVHTAYRVKSGKEVIKAVPTRALTFAPGAVGETPADLMTAQEQSYLPAVWDAVQAALQRLEL